MDKSNFVNLYEETITFFKENGLNIKDIIAVSDGKNAKSFKEIKDIFKSINYDDGFGCQVINPNLTIIMKNHIIIRHEYDGLEYYKLFNLNKSGNSELEIIPHDISNTYYYIDEV